jgi:hypothetical protein
MKPEWGRGSNVPGESKLAKEFLDEILQLVRRFHFSDKRGGLNGSTQHSARTQPVVKTKAEIAR